MPGTAEPGPLKIEISVGPDRVLRYGKKDGVVVRAGNTVRWICNSHDYGIQFTNNVSPFEEQVLSLSRVKGEETDPCTARRTGKGRVAFKYVVSVHIPNSTDPIVIDDPVIIVEDG